MQKILSLIYLTLIILCSAISLGRDRPNRMGIGYSNQFVNQIPALSFKLQRTKAFAMGGMLAFDTNKSLSGFGAGVKFYRNLFDEPHANFYAAGLLALINQKTVSQTETGFQFDFTLGSEFSLPSLDSIGLSFEFGISLSKISEFSFATTGSRFFITAIHFYL